MPPLTDAAELVSHRTAKFTFAAAVKWGIGTILCVAVAWFVWNAYDVMVKGNTADLKESNTFIRDQLLKQNERQGRMIALATKQIEISTKQNIASSELLAQNMEVMKLTQNCLQEVTALYRELVRLMEKVYERLRTDFHHQTEPRREVAP